MNQKESLRNHRSLLIKGVIRIFFLNFCFRLRIVLSLAEPSAVDLSHFFLIREDVYLETKRFIFWNEIFLIEPLV